MARETLIVERVICDICGAQTDEAQTEAISIGGDRWELDVCAADAERIRDQFSAWTAKARKTPRTKRRNKATAVEEWSYLESLGFERHRGRKSAAERAALVARHDSAQTRRRSR